MIEVYFRGYGQWGGYFVSLDGEVVSGTFKGDYANGIFVLSKNDEITFHETDSLKHVNQLYPCPKENRTHCAFSTVDKEIPSTRQNSYFSIDSVEILQIAKPQSIIKETKSEAGWITIAKQIAIEIYNQNKKLTVTAIATKTHKEIEARFKRGDKSVTIRTGGLPKIDSIRKELAGFKKRK